MTLEPKVFCSSKMAVTRCRSKLWWRKAHQSKALDVSYLSSLSKRDLKHSGTFFNFFNNSNVGKMSFSKKCRKSILTGATIRKKLCWIQWCNPFWLKPSKMMSFWWFSFCIFLYFLSFLTFLTILQFLTTDCLFGWMACTGHCYRVRSVISWLSDKEEQAISKII